MSELDPTRQAQDPGMTFESSRGEAAVMAVAAALAGGATATAAAMAMETTPAQANVPAIYGSLVPGEQTQEGPWAVEQHAYDGPPLAHASNNPVAEASSTVPDATSQQECIDDALAPMHITNARLKRPRHDDPATQVALALAKTQRMPFNCLDQYGIYRDVRFEFDVEDGQHHGFWNPFLYETLEMSGDGLYSRGQPSMVLRLPYPFMYEPPTKSQLEIGIYDCTPGPEDTGVKLRTEEIAVNAQTNEELDHRKFKVVPVNHILPKPC